MVSFLMLPSLLTNHRYEVRFALSGSDICSAQRLRYAVFNLEMGIGLEASAATGLDADVFDETCEHLMVIERESGDVVGTYRMRTGLRALECHGYYSEKQFDFAPYEERRASILELGRACVRKDHRSFAVIGLLWRGIVDYATAHNCRYLVGCSSVSSQDPALGWAMYRRFERENQVASSEWLTAPRPAYAMPPAEPLAHCPSAPRLLAAYLGVGARICAPPALDREFRTLVFLTMLDCLGSTPSAGRFLDNPKVP
jgi:putative hemolysin